MKKSLVALAALAATSAFSQVTIDGLFDAGYQAIDYKGTTITGIGGNGANTSQLNFRINEDLGGGLKVSARLESDFNAVQFKGNTGVASAVNMGAAGAEVAGSRSINSVASTFGNGEVWAGISGGFGGIQMGSVNMNTLTSTLLIQPFGTAIGSGYTTNGGVLRGDTAAATVRDENAIKYTSPTMNGFTGTLYWSAKQTKAANAAASATTLLVPQQTAYSTGLGAYDKLGSKEVGINYANGPLAATFSTLTQDSVGVSAMGANGQADGTTATRLNTMGGAYTFGATKVSVGVQTNKTTTGTVATDTTYNVLAATHTTGPWEFMASTGTIKQNAGTTYKDKSTNLTGLGVNYNLSKMSNLYARYEAIDDKANILAASATLDQVTAGTRKRTAIGVKVGF